MPEEDDTTIRISLKTKRELAKHKIHPRESYDELLKRMIAEIGQLLNSDNSGEFLHEDVN